ncbi:hypothetical protein C2W64_00143 [Brevibacillus laterosporus]|nr:hypothetical protein C2W64_00143 [Brevibacillus laterosporus]
MVAFVFVLVDPYVLVITQLFATKSYQLFLSGFSTFALFTLFPL